MKKSSGLYTTKQWVAELGEELWDYTVLGWKWGLFILGVLGVLVAVFSSTLSYN